MKKLFVTILIVSVGQFVWGQVNDGLIDLGKAYRQFMFRNSPPESILKSLDKYDKTELSFVSDFIQETITPQGNILSDKYLKRPTDKELKWIYIIVQINYNVRKENPVDNNELIEKFNSKEISTRELLDNYYSMVFTGYGNKINPYDLSKVDFQLNNYGLKDDTEKGIFFLESMRLNGILIFGYMNIVKPPNYTKALEYINKYPKYNGTPYYQFMDLNFPDFKIHIDSETKQESYKEYYIDKYYETLLSHLDCLKKIGDKDKIYDLVLGSILKEDIYFKYSKREKDIKKLLKEYKK
jgi:hypothetical protein